ncbi:hypothetical protein D3C84_844760 [compost metagenome]
MGAYAHPVLCHSLHGHCAASQQAGDVRRQQFVEKDTLTHPEIRQGMVIHPHTTAQPAVGIVCLAQPC